MKHITLFTAFTIFLSLVSVAQKNGKTNFSIGPEVGITAGDNFILWGTGFGGSAQAEHFFTENISGTGYIGFISYLGKSIIGSDKFKPYNIIPVRIGPCYYIGNSFHLGLQTGIGFQRHKKSSSTGEVFSSAGFTYSPQIGYNLKINKRQALDITLKYDRYTNGYTTVPFSAGGLRVAYVFY